MFAHCGLWFSLLYFICLFILDYLTTQDSKKMHLKKEALVADHMQYWPPQSEGLLHMRQYADGKLDEAHTNCIHTVHRESDDCCPLSTS